MNEDNFKEEFFVGGIPEDYADLHGNLNEAGIIEEVEKAEYNGEKYYNIKNLDIYALESDELYKSTEILCEGPIEGLVDKKGNALSYVNTKNLSNVALGKGVYLNNVPIIDTKLRRFNFVTAGFDIVYGDESQNVLDYPSTIYRYNSRLYLCENTLNVQYKKPTVANGHGQQVIDGNHFYENGLGAQEHDDALEYAAPEQVFRLQGFLEYKRVSDFLNWSPSEYMWNDNASSLKGTYYEYISNAAGIDSVQIGYKTTRETNWIDTLADKWFGVDPSTDTRTTVSKKGLFMLMPSIVERARSSSNPFRHKIRNKYCDLIKVQIGIDELYRQSDEAQGNGVGSTQPVEFGLCVEIAKSNSAEAYYCIVGFDMAYSRDSFVLDIPIQLNLNINSSDEYVLSVFPLMPRVNPEDSEVFVKLRVASIIEQVRRRGQFSYPYTVCAKTAISSRHFGTDASRSYDLKLLKVKIPNNYDAEARSYEGNWVGKFDGFLKWTDNPAWVYYDLCTNTRYGIGKGKIFDKDLNKWDLYKIAKYCDELVVSKTPYKYVPDEFIINEHNHNEIFIERKGRNLRDFMAQYPPVLNSTYVEVGGEIVFGSVAPSDLPDGSFVYNFQEENGGPHNSMIFLFDLEDSDGKKIKTNYKKIIWSVVEGVLRDNNDFTVIDDDDDSFSYSTHYKITLINDFGPRKIFERDKTRTLLEGFKSNVSQQGDLLVALSTKSQIENALTLADKNTEDGAKDYILNEYEDKYKSLDPEGIGAFVRNEVSKSIFSGTGEDEEVRDSLNKNKKIFGTCVPRAENYRDALEPRFSANLLIENETEALKILDDISSIFRGISYYKNGYLTATVDVDKEPSYIFNNTNVKDGLFTYSSGSLDGNYSVAKVLYKDKFNLFNDEVEIVEDPDLVKNYGIVPKEILGFGVTSKDQAKRLGVWLLATNRFENQTVTFTTDIQGLLLKPSDVIQIEDDFKSFISLQGRVVTINYSSNYVTVDRKLDVNLAGSKIKFLMDKNYKSVDGIQDSSESSELDRKDILELKIDRIENNTSRVYIDTDYNFDGFTSVLASTPFIIEDVNSKKVNSGLYKIVTITEEDINEYSLFCIKHNPVKYENVDRDELVFNANRKDDIVSFSRADSVKEFDLTRLGFGAGGVDDFYTVSRIQGVIDTSECDYAIVEDESYITAETDAGTFAVLNIDFNEILSRVISRADKDNYDLPYYQEALSILEDGGGFLCKILAKGQSVTFKISQDDQNKIKSVFLGRYPDATAQPFVISHVSGIKIYLYNKLNQIVDIKA